MDPLSDNEKFIVTYGTNNEHLSGTHEFELKAHLEKVEYQHITNVE